MFFLNGLWINGIFINAMNDNKCLDPFCSHHHGEAPPKGRFLWILSELLAHLPFSITSTIIGILIMVAFTVFNKMQYLTGIFHVFYPTHLLFGAMAPTAMFWRLSHKRNILHAIYAIIIGFTGSVVLCSVSNIILPYLGGRLFIPEMRWHFCLTEHPVVILPFVAIGIIIGFWSQALVRYNTRLAHSAHVLVSTMATLLYLIGFGMSDWLVYIGIVLLITVFSVLIPCCLGDIVYPMLFVKRQESNEGKT